LQGPFYWRIQDPRSVKDTPDETVPEDDGTENLNPPTIKYDYGMGKEQEIDRTLAKAKAEEQDIDPTLAKAAQLCSSSSCSECWKSYLI
jgi:hypothetical protein